MIDRIEQAALAFVTGLASAVFGSLLYAAAQMPNRIPDASAWTPDGYSMLIEDRRGEDDDIADLLATSFEDRFNGRAPLPCSDIRRNIGSPFHTAVHPPADQRSGW